MTSVKIDLMKSVEDTESDRQSTSSSPQPEAGSSIDTNILNDLELHLRELISSQQFGKAIKVLHHIRAQFPGLYIFVFYNFV